VAWLFICFLFIGLSFMSGVAVRVWVQVSRFFFFLSVRVWVQVRRFFFFFVVGRGGACVGAGQALRCSKTLGST
jgi:hypothetical protein